MSAERPYQPSYDNPLCIVCEDEITPDQNCTRSSEGYWWHYRCRRGVGEAVSRLSQSGPEEATP